MCYKYIKIELKTSLSVSSKKENSRCMTSSATSLFGLVIKEELSYTCVFHWPICSVEQNRLFNLVAGFMVNIRVKKKKKNSSQLFKRRYRLKIYF